MPYKLPTAAAGLAGAQKADGLDPVAHYRDQFVIVDPNLVYFDGNSLGRMPKQTAEHLQHVIHTEWSEGLIRGWGRGWYEAPARIGDKIGQLLGAAPGQVLACDSTSVNLYKLVMAALQARPDRTDIVSDALNFPSDLYIMQGAIAHFGNRHQLQLVVSRDNELTVNTNDLYSLITPKTALVVLSHVTFKSGFIYDMQAITQKAHDVGALVIWDLSHSAGALPMQLDAWHVDMVVGCGYKFLNGGPGAPAFLYINASIQDQVQSPIWGWFGQKAPFAFDLQYEPAPGLARFLAGTPPMLSLSAVESAVDMLNQVGMSAIREKSVALTEYMISLCDAHLVELGFTMGSPRDAAIRGSHVSIRHPLGYQINQALIAEMNVIPDFREPDNLRLGLSPLTTSFTEVWHGVDRIRHAVSQGLHNKYPATRAAVT
ncbi:MAG: kynureninase [Chloroflexales bacterium]|nr:kynureninase [Chloroflexales bacterium]